ncbi:MAG: nicotinate (nicotinamide) nucleotide adenylyltransferase [Lentisphaerota bacterium]
MRIGLFGGTFDPIHIGHLNLAKSLIDKNYLDRIIFIPAAKPPHKPGKPITEFSQRCKMVELAVKDISYFSVSNLEEKRLPLPSYTYDTVKEFKKIYPEDTLFLIIGEDSLLQIHTWHRIKELISCCEIITYPRPNENSSLEKLEAFWSKEDAEKLFASLVNLKLYEVSSTQIRESLKSGYNENKVLTSEVLDYIKENNLYR